MTNNQNYMALCTVICRKYAENIIHPEMNENGYAATTVTLRTFAVLRSTVLALPRAFLRIPTRRRCRRGCAHAIRVFVLPLLHLLRRHEIRDL